MGIPTAKEMAEKTSNILNSQLEEIFTKIEKQLEIAPGYNATVSLSEKEEKVANAAMQKLIELGYNVKLEPGFYEDRPCGGHVNAKLILSWG